VELFTFIRLFLSSHAAVTAENLFLRKQLALFKERRVRPRRSTAATRAFMVLLSRFFDWRKALVIVKPRHSLNSIALHFGCSGDGSLESEADRDCHRICAN
jgi:hypothetical protein